MILKFDKFILCLSIFFIGCTTISNRNSKMSEKNFYTKNFSSTINYYIDLPDDYCETNQYPLIVFLHGMGERGNAQTISKLRATGLPAVIDQKKLKLPFIIVSPQCPETSSWISQLSNLESLTEYIIDNYPIDKKRVYLTGLSMGGYGTWMLGCTRSDLFAAIAPICGGGIQRYTYLLKDTPIWCFHGEDDDIVPLSESEKMVEALKNFGGNVKFTVYPGVKHNSWTATYENPELYNWFLSITK